MEESSRARRMVIDSFREKKDRRESITILVSPELRNDFKSTCALKNLTIKKVLTMMIESFVKQYKDKEK